MAAISEKTTSMTVDMVDEPQNQLTRRFTEPEWKALRNLKSDLPNVCEEAFPDDEKASYRPFIIWGVSIDPCEPDAKASVILMRFLRAKKLHVAATKRMLVETLRWRAAHLPKQTAEDIAADDATFGKWGHVFGKDKDGRPVVYIVTGRDVDLETLYADVDRYVRWRIGFQEMFCMLLDYETVDRVVTVIDFAGLHRGPFPANKRKAEAEADRITRSYYPGLGSKLFVVNFPFPRLMKGIFWLLRPFFSARRMKNLHILGVGSNVIGPAMLPFISASDLPKPYGGSAEPKWCLGPAWEDAGIKRSSV